MCCRIAFLINNQISRRGAGVGLTGRSRKPLWSLATQGSNPCLSAFQLNIENCCLTIDGRAEKSITFHYSIINGKYSIKNWGRSSVGRASRSQCEGRGFNPHRLHGGCARWGVSGALFPAIRFSRIEFPSEAYSPFVVAVIIDVDGSSPSQ